MRDLAIDDGLLHLLLIVRRKQRKLETGREKGSDPMYATVELKLLKSRGPMVVQDKATEGGEESGFVVAPVGCRLERLQEERRRKQTELCQLESKAKVISCAHLALIDQERNLYRQAAIVEPQGGLTVFLDGLVSPIGQLWPTEMFECIQGRFRRWV